MGAGRAESFGRTAAQRSEVSIGRLQHYQFRLVKFYSKEKKYVVEPTGDQKCVDSGFPDNLRSNGDGCTLVTTTQGAAGWVSRRRDRSGHDDSSHSDTHNFARRLFSSDNMSMVLKDRWRSGRLPCFCVSLHPQISNIPWTSFWSSIWITGCPLPGPDHAEAALACKELGPR